jgi:hypothetical protein
MNSPKLLEAIAELETRRKAINDTIDDAIVHMRKAHDALSGSEKVTEPRQSFSRAESSFSPRRRKSGRPSYVEDAVSAIRDAGHPLHISDILAHIKSTRGEAERSSVESSLLREPVNAKKLNRPSRVVRTAPSTFGIPNAMAMAS